MKEKVWHLAQINIGKIIGESIEDPVMEKFVAQLDEVNALAEGSPGFIWRLKDEGNNATHFNPYNDRRIIVNFSVWATLDHLLSFVHQGRHAEVLRSRREWGTFPQVKFPRSKKRWNGFNPCRIMVQHLMPLTSKQDFPCRPCLLLKRNSVCLHEI
jgi:hypothetical protein